MIQFNESYEKPHDPQQIRNDFIELLDHEGGEKLIYKLSSYLDTDTLSRFIDDSMMGRV